MRNALRHIESLYEAASTPERRLAKDSSRQWRANGGPEGARTLISWLPYKEWLVHAALQSRFTSPGIGSSFEATTVPVLEQFWYTIINWANRQAATP